MKYIILCIILSMITITVNSKTECQNDFYGFTPYTDLNDEDQLTTRVSIKHPIEDWSKQGGFKHMLIKKDKKNNSCVITKVTCIDKFKHVTPCIKRTPICFKGVEIGDLTAQVSFFINDEEKSYKTNEYSLELINFSEVYESNAFENPDYFKTQFIFVKGLEMRKEVIYLEEKGINHYMEVKIIKHDKEKITPICRKTIKIAPLAD